MVQSLQKILGKLINLSAVFTIALVIFILSLYIQTAYYQFPEHQPFKGDFIYNPYQELPDSIYKANFHAHSKAWGGITNGVDTEQEIFDGYRSRNYDVAGISNYHTISLYGKDKASLYVPVYEHGINILKAHYLVIGPEKVTFFDLPLWQSTHHQQSVINRIRTVTDKLAIAHPRFGGGRTFEDVEKLTGYDFIEVLNHYRSSEDFWDKALSAGRLVWVLGDDDIHDIKHDPSFRLWNMIYADIPHRDSISANMKKGLHFAVDTYDGILPNQLKSCTLSADNTLTIRMKGAADSILFIGQNGHLLSGVVHADTASYTFTAADTYVRPVVYNQGKRLLLNPSIRYDGKNLPLNSQYKVAENVGMTWLYRLLMGVIIFFLIIMARYILRNL